MLTERQTLLALIADPQVPEIQKATYRQTVQRIDKRLKATPTPLQTQTPEQATVVFPAATPIRTQQPTPQPVRQQREISWKKPEGLKIADTIAVEVPQGPNLIRFEWSDKQSEDLTEGQIRSRFVTAIRDLCQSSLAEQGRLEQIPEQYVVFTRAVAYYRGLTTLWNREPSMSELRISQGRVRNIIFDMIVINAK